MPSRLAIQLGRRALHSTPRASPPASSIRPAAILPLRTSTPSRIASRLQPSPHRFSTGAPSRAAPMAVPTDTAAADLAAQAQITPDSLSATLRHKIGATHVQIEDMSGGCGQAFTALIVSPQFVGKTLLARHRLVNGALKEEIAAIHAWTPRCLTPEQWEAELAKMKA